MILNKDARKVVALWHKNSERIAGSNALLIKLDGFYYRIQLTGYFRSFYDDINTIIPKLETLLQGLFYGLKHSSLPYKILDYLHAAEHPNNWTYQANMLLRSLVPYYHTDIKDMLGICIHYMSEHRATVLVTYQDCEAVVDTICIKRKGE